MHRTTANSAASATLPRQPRPVEPYPPVPRADSATKSSTMLKLACTTGTITSCAMRYIGSMVKATSLRFQALTISWPW